MFHSVCLYKMSNGSKDVRISKEKATKYRWLPGLICSSGLLSPITLLNKAVDELISVISDFSSTAPHFQKFLIFTEQKKKFHYYGNIKHGTLVCVLFPTLAHRNSKNKIILRDRRRRKARKRGYLKNWALKKESYGLIITTIIIIIIIVSF